MPATCSQFFQLLVPWFPEAEAAFQMLLSKFASSSTMQMPNLELQFIIEVDASEIGIRAVLCQRFPEYKKIHSCASFSQKLSATEGNYDVGNWEWL